MGACANIHISRADMQNEDLVLLMVSIILKGRIKEGVKPVESLA